MKSNAQAMYMKTRFQMTLLMYFINIINLLGMPEGSVFHNIHARKHIDDVYFVSLLSSTSAFLSN
jgi:hypothetical protein